ncbi:phage tail protein [Clostridium sp. SHJSY1]|uniref:phage tail spike protein n=1 Tax=Clostridium sp. SHJSY1 TaxID=2942483 RepID=UPI002874DA79|nr:phage tail spike protein [Clostridium sp. SHJSY1]MDS0525453.1 phage tail protein [Clostridium sp. SHJSY1]
MKKEIKVAWFSSNAARDKVLTTNGKSLDNYCTKCIATEDFGNYVLDGTFTIDAQGHLEEEDILKVRLDYGDEIFRISKVTKGTRYIDIVARQVTIAESLTLYLDDVRPTNVSGQGALSHLLTNAAGTKEIILQSDIATSNTAYYQDMSLYKAIHDSDNSFLTRWGGECLRRQYTLSINTHIGSDRNVSIREKKNLTGFSGESNIDDLVTRARGKGNNGILGSWIDSPLKGNYARVYTNTIEYSDVKVKGESDTDGFATEALAKAELDRLVKLEFSQNDIDKLKATYTINFVQLEKTEEYKNYVAAERIYLGDTIRVYVPKIKTDIKVRAIARKYNVLAKKVDEITLSNTVTLSAMSMNSVVADLKKQYANTNNNSIASYIDSIIKSGMKDSYLVVRANELLVMDTKDINTAIKVTRFNKNGLGFSSTGYYGKYNYGFTSDGKINASLIATGILSTIMIQNADGSFQIDLSKTGGASFFNNNKKAMEMSNNALKFFNWNHDGEGVGTIGSTVLHADNTKPAISLWNEKNSWFQIGYRNSDGSISPYLEFDKYGISNEGCPIQLYDNIQLNGYRIYLNKKSDNAFMTIATDGRVYMNGGVHVNGQLTCTGEKPRVVNTSVGHVCINAYETPNPKFADYSENDEVLDENGICTVILDSLFLETVSLEEGYQVFLTKYGKGDIWVEDRNMDSFLVHGEPNLKFSWNIVGKQKGYEHVRMKRVEIEPKETKMRKEEIRIG